jgi:hypothetical protein
MSTLTLLFLGFLVCCAVGVAVAFVIVGDE